MDRQFDYPRAVAIRHAAQSAALLLAFIEVQTELMAQEAAETDDFTTSQQKETVHG